MKKIFLILVGISLVLVCMPFSDVNALETISLQDGDTSITQNVIDVGNEYARKMEELSRKARMDEEVWSLTSTQVVVPYNTLKISHGDFVEPGSSITRECSWSIGVGVPIGNTGVSLSVSVSDSTKITRSGPSSSDRLANNVKATHRSFFAVGKGKVVRYTYRVTSKYSGTFIRNQTVTQAADVTTLSCSQLVNINGNNLTVENADGNKVRTTTYTNYLAQMKKTGSPAHYYYYF